MILFPESCKHFYQRLHFPGRSFCLTGCVSLQFEYRYFLNHKVELVFFFNLKYTLFLKHFSQLFLLVINHVPRVPFVLMLLASPQVSVLLLVELPVTQAVLRVISVQLAVRSFSGSTWTLSRMAGRLLLRACLTTPVLRNNVVSRPLQRAMATVKGTFITEVGCRKWAHTAWKKRS